MTDAVFTREMLAPREFPHAWYRVDIGWDYLEGHLENEVAVGFDADPPFQRAHVWNHAQRVAYVEHVMCGGDTGRTIVVAHVGKHGHDYDKNCKLRGYALVDGKQRMETARAFLRGEVRVFADAEHPEGFVWSQMERPVRRRCGSFSWQLVVLPTEADILRLYLRLNAGGTQHTPDELDKVRAMLAGGVNNHAHSAV